MTTLADRVILTRNNVLVRETARCLMLGEPTDNHPASSGIILAMSPKVQALNQLSIGDRLFFSKYAGVFVELNGQRYVLLALSECFGTIDDHVTRDQFVIGETTDMIAYVEKLKSRVMKSGHNLNLTNVEY